MRIRRSYVFEAVLSFVKDQFPLSLFFSFSLFSFFKWYILSISLLHVLIFMFVVVRYFRNAWVGHDRDVTHMYFA
jgi:hypothetical protein